MQPEGGANPLGGQLRLRSATLDQLAEGLLTGVLRGVVINESQVPGVFDVELSWRPDVAAGAGVDRNDPRPSLSVIEDLVLAYDNPVMRALVQLVPSIGTPIDTVLSEAITQFNAKRTKAFFDELARGAASLDPQTVRSEPFLHAFFSTTKAALGSRQREKIELLARLLASGTRGVIEYGDDYEELLAILDDTRYEELTCWNSSDQWSLENGAD